MNRGRFLLLGRMFVLAGFVGLAGCASSEAYQAGFAQTRAELARPLEITRLFLDPKLEVDERTRNYSDSKGPSTIVFSAHSMRLDLGQQLMTGLEEARRLLFTEGAPGATLRIRLEDFQWDYYYVTRLASSDVVYDMRMKIDAELLDQAGRSVYRRSLEAANRGVGTKGLFEMGFTGEHMVEPLARGSADLVALWVRRFAEDLTRDPGVLALAGGPSRPEVKPPEIAIQGPADGSVTEAGEVRLHGFIRSEHPLKEHRITVNGKPLEDVRGVHAIVSEATRLPFERLVRLPLGQSVIAVTAACEAGGVSQRLVTVTRTEPSLAPVAGAPGSKLGERFAVVIGISRYKHEAAGIPPLEGAAVGAGRLALFLRSEQGGRFPEQNVLLLTNEQATSAAVRQALFVFLKRAIEEDLVVFFFCGHGAPEPGATDNYYLLTHDADPANLPGTAIPTWDVDMAFSRNIRARRAALFIDACHVPALGTTEGLRALGGSNLINRYLKRLAESGEGRALVTAAREGELTDRVAGSGLFTRYLLEALSGKADQDLDGVVTLGETIDYLTDMVAAATRGRQRPEVSGKFDRGLPLAVTAPERAR